MQTKQTCFETSPPPHNYIQRLDCVMQTKYHTKMLDACFFCLNAANIGYTGLSVLLIIFFNARIDKHTLDMDRYKTH